MVEYNLDRFLQAQEEVYSQALNEIKSGRKKTHWIWFIFPQISGLGSSDISKYYAINDLLEAKDYLNNPILRNRLIEISKALMDLTTDNPIKVLGYIDSVKVKSCMTLFYVANPKYTIFKEVLDKFYNGKLDKNTLEILNIHEGEINFE